MADRTTEYAKLIVSGDKICGKSEYLACQRHLDDMQRGKEFDYIFDAKVAEKHINLANMLVIGEGIKAQPLKTRDFQNFIIGSLFGWRKKRSNTRRYREAYIQMARKNGKSFIAGELCNDFATFSGYKYGEIYIAATKQDQANIVWKEVQKFVESDVDLKDLYRIREHEHTIKSTVTETVIKSIGRDTKSADGYKPLLAVLDELHAHPNNQMYKLMQDGQVGLENSLTLAITTAGFDLNSFCYEHYKFCKKILSGAIEKDSQFVYICEMDKEDDIWKPENWAKANPLLLWNEDNTLNQEMIARMAEKAIDAREKQGAELVNFLTKTLNQWVTSGGDNSYIDAEKWRECGVDKTLDDMQGRECYLGIDLSSGGDLTSIALVFPLENEKVYIWSKSYMPELRLQEHIRTDDVPYQIWARQGLLTLTSGLYGIKTDYKLILREMKELISANSLKVVGVGYDRHNISGILSDLEEIFDCDLTDVVQSAKGLSDATVDFQLSVKAGLVEYDKRNQLLTWSMLNAVTVSNSFGEIKIDKQSAKNRIDPCDAVIDAWKLYLLSKNVKKISGSERLNAWLKILEAED